MLKSARRVALLVLTNLIIIVVLAGFVEGTSSLILALRDFRLTHKPSAEQRHTRYDRELGWINIPGARIRDMYGPGRDLTINARGFRSTTELSTQVRLGQTRIVCSGDSFTLGFGVADSDTWCARLATDHHALETVNMGQGGYGVDQAYLWYKRDGAGFQHQVQIFGFVTDDFRRMQARVFMGHGKPLLLVNDGRLEVSNVPVPNNGLRSWLRGLRQEPWESLRSVQLAERILSRRTPRRRLASAAMTPQARQVFHLILGDLKALNTKRGSQLVLVYFPASYDLNHKLPDQWRSFIRQEAEKLGVPFLDLYPSFRAMTPALRATLYIQDGELDFPGAAGHYTAKGNQLVADSIYKFLVDSDVIPAATRDSN